MECSNLLLQSGNCLMFSRHALFCTCTESCCHKQDCALRHRAPHMESDGKELWAASTSHQPGGDSNWSCTSTTGGLLRGTGSARS